MAPLQSGTTDSGKRIGYWSRSAVTIPLWHALRVTIPFREALTDGAAGRVSSRWRR